MLLFLTKKALEKYILKNGITNSTLSSLIKELVLRLKNKKKKWTPFTQW